MVNLFKMAAGDGCFKKCCTDLCPNFHDRHGSLFYDKYPKNHDNLANIKIIKFHKPKADHVM